MPSDSVSPGRDSLRRTRSRFPSPSLSTVVWTKTVSSIALSRENCGWLTPFFSSSHGGGVGASSLSADAAGAMVTTVVAAATSAMNARRT